MLKILFFVSRFHLSSSKIHDILHWLESWVLEAVYFSIDLGQHHVFLVETILQGSAALTCGSRAAEAWIALNSDLPKLRKVAVFLDLEML